ncbi:hypothetical protein FHT39_000897 [Mitsuaria sp. BK045]|uniref:hypothetical protein n=1 Tax=unclassified Roseateles TaxID=2626991 RepID=UPI0016149483|nr:MULTISPECIES: hypothetical protein [unclassified Roseateles]MBB3292258.1 hypothetical protein [Mitsuaria sp. BK041]MBB3361475.1 hypothetical protein [Mitsuaria sp. BK045]
MNLLQPWMLAAGALAGAGVGAAVASAWWGRKLRTARALIDQLQASRRQIEEQVGQARRQIEKLQMEMLELRLTMEHMRRKTQFAASRPLPIDSGDSMLAPISAHAPLSVSAVARPNVVVDLASDAAATASATPLTHAERFERARERAAAGGFSPTEPMERPMERPMQRATPVTPTPTPTLPPIPFGFLPTQPHPEP